VRRLCSGKYPQLQVIVDTAFGPIGLDSQRPDALNQFHQPISGLLEVRVTPQLHASSLPGLV
jgi:hypothetical protein